MFEMELVYSLEIKVIIPQGAMPIKLISGVVPLAGEGLTSEVVDGQMDSQKTRNTAS